MECGRSQQQEGDEFAEIWSGLTRSKMQSTARSSAWEHLDHQRERKLSLALYVS